MTGALRSASRSTSNADRSATNYLFTVNRMSRPELVEHWTKAFGQPPPKGSSTALLRRAIAYCMQEKQFGGLKKRELKALLQFAAPIVPVASANYNGRTPGKQGLPSTAGDTYPDAGPKDAGTPTVFSAPRQNTASALSTLAPSLRPGMRLVRSWQGKTHVVEVVEDGLVWNGKTYGSLSAVALAITGARWSGRRFFRL